jgi:hypothetical protein
MNQFATLSELLLAAGGLAALQFLLSLWLSERFKAALARETGQFLESIRWDMRVREQAAKVAEYMASALWLKSDSSPEKYEKANRLAWELALWLPPDVFRSVTRAVTAPNPETNALSVLIGVRKVLLKDAAGDLTQDEVMFHAPGAGKRA